MLVFEQLIAFIVFFRGLKVVPDDEMLFNPIPSNRSSSSDPVQKASQMSHIITDKLTIYLASSVAASDIQN